MKNITSYNVIMPTFDEINILINSQDAEGLQFRPCPERLLMTAGFDGNQCVTKFDYGYRINFKIEKKVLPAKLVNKKLKDRLDHIKNNTGKKPNKKEKDAIKEDLIFELCAKALTMTDEISAFYIEKDSRLIVSTGSKIDTSTITSILCHLIGSLETTTLYVSGVSNSLSVNLAEELRLNNEPSFAGFKYSDKLHLKNALNDTAKFGGDYESDAILELFDSGYSVKLVRLSKGGVTFDLTDEFKIKCIKYEIDEYDDVLFTEQEEKRP